MNNTHETPLIALEKYHKLQERYNGLVRSFNDIKGLNIIARNMNCIVADIIGYRVEICFSMVSDGNESPSFDGQINIDLIKNADTTQETRTNLFTHWYDDLGNVRKKYESKNAQFDIGNVNYRDDIFSSIISRLLESPEMKPVNRKIDYGKLL